MSELGPKSEQDPGMQATNAAIENTPGAYPRNAVQTGSYADDATPETLAQIVWKRRAEYIVQKHIKVKVGTWNVASLSGTEKDLKGWFVDGQGIEARLTNIKLDTKEGAAEAYLNIESVEDQEERHTKKESTIPINDPGLLPGGEEIGLYVLGLQEIVDISSATEALKPHDAQPARRWKQAVARALPPGYHRVAEQQLLGLLVLIYAAPHIQPTISNVSTQSVGTGLLGYMGNKGAVSVRLLLGDTTRLVFVNCHLTAGNEKANLERRNWDYNQIISRTKFTPVSVEGSCEPERPESIGDEDFGFWFGDLNYRLEGLPGDDVRRLLMLHTRGEYTSGRASKSKINQELESSNSLEAQSSRNLKEKSNAREMGSDLSRQTTHSTTSAETLVDDADSDSSKDPTSLQSTLSSLLPHDQLHAQMRQHNAFYDGWREGDISFLPTYKYDVGSVGMFDSSEKKRGPSWCDRVLYRTRRDKHEFHRLSQDAAAARIRDAEMKAKGVTEAAKAEEVLFEYNPDMDGTYEEDDRVATNSEAVPTKAGYVDQIKLDYYTSHQRVLSSDHKPLEAIFTIAYDAVDTDLRAKIQQEVARNQDKGENERRPTVTVVFEQIPDECPGVETSSDRGSLDFGELKFKQPKVAALTVANTGSTPAYIGFVDRISTSGEMSPAIPSWISATFDRDPVNSNNNPDALHEFAMSPGEAINIELVAHVNQPALARKLNDSEHSLSEILVLRVRDGRDHFLPVYGHWHGTKFGVSIDQLSGKTHGQGPVSPLSEAARPVRSSAPPEIFRLTEAIEMIAERAFAELAMRNFKGHMGTPITNDDESENAEVVVQAGWPFSHVTTPDMELKEHVELVRNEMDRGCSFDQIIWPSTSTAVARIESFALTLLEFLDALEDGLISSTLWHDLEHGIVEAEKIHHKRALSRDDIQTIFHEALSLAPASGVSFTFITFMLTNLSKEIAPVPAKRLTWLRAYRDIFAGTLIRVSGQVKGKARKASETRVSMLVEAFLGEDDEFT